MQKKKHLPLVIIPIMLGVIVLIVVLIIVVIAITVALMVVAIIVVALIIIIARHGGEDQLLQHGSITSINREIDLVSSVFPRHPRELHSIPSWQGHSATTPGGKRRSKTHF